MKTSKELSATELAPLRKVLVSITKEGDPNIDAALSELEHAIGNYRAMAKALLKTGGGPTRFSAKKLRIELNALVMNLTKASDTAAKTSIAAQCMFADQSANPGEWLELTNRLTAATATAERAWAVAKALRNKEKNFGRTVLAWRVALVLDNILHVRPTSTRHTRALPYGKHGGAKYSQVLEVVLNLAVGHSTDLEKAIAAGRRAWKDPNFPPYIRK